jgi:hypothetical protein
MAKVFIEHIGFVPWSRIYLFRRKNNQLSTLESDLVQRIKVSYEINYKLKKNTKIKNLLFSKNQFNPVP